MLRLSVFILIIYIARCQSQSEFALKAVEFKNAKMLLDKFGFNWTDPRGADVLDLVQLPQLLIHITNKTILPESISPGFNVNAGRIFISQLANIWQLPQETKERIKEASKTCDYYVDEFFHFNESEKTILYLRIGFVQPMPDSGRFIVLYVKNTLSLVQILDPDVVAVLKCLGNTTAQCADTGKFSKASVKNVELWIKRRAMNQFRQSNSQRIDLIDDGMTKLQRFLPDTYAPPKMCSEKIHPLDPGTAGCHLSDPQLNQAVGLVKHWLSDETPESAKVDKNLVKNLTTEAHVECTLDEQDFKRSLSSLKHQGKISEVLEREVEEAVEIRSKRLGDLKRNVEKRSIEPYAIREAIFVNTNGGHKMHQLVHARMFILVDNQGKITYGLASAKVDLSRDLHFNFGSHILEDTCHARDVLCNQMQHPFDVHGSHALHPILDFLTKKTMEAFQDYWRKKTACITESCMTNDQ